MISFVLILIASCVFCQADEIDDILPYIAIVESNNNPNAVSGAGAVGTYQITPIVLVEYNRENFVEYLWPLGTYSYEDLFVPEVNKEIATWYLRRLRDHYLKNVKHDIASKGLGQKWLYKNIYKKGEENTTLVLCEDALMSLVLAAYNGGITRLRKNGYDINKMPRETREYVRKVMALKKEAK